MTKKKLILITEYLNSPYDEGIKKTVYNLFLELDKAYNLQVICRAGFPKDNIQIVQANKLFLSRSIKKTIKDFGPETLIYFPFASATFAGYLRFFVLSLLNKRAMNILIALQPKPLKKWQEQIVKFIRPGFALTPSPQLKTFWDSIHVNNKLLPLLTDLNTFKPLVKENTKAALRKKYHLPAEAFIISHMGHLNEGRNLRSLIPLQKAGYQVLVVGSSSTPRDSLGPASLKEELTNAGIIIMDGYIKKIEEIYQLSDVYIFPVVAKTGSIGMPLSIMEARACGIPVITTDFGSLKHFLNSDHGNIYYSNPVNFLEKTKQIESDKTTNRNKTLVHELNDQFLYIIHSAIHA